MRVLPLCLLTLLLTGCSLLQKPSQSVSQEQKPAQTEAEHKPVVHSAPVKLYTDATELVSKPFRDLGEVYGDDCQSSTQDSPPNLATARKRMQIRASGMKANAVLLHKCEVVSAAQGCYRQAVCQGSALQVSN